MRIALYQPDIPQNTGNIFRLGACLGVPVDIIEPTGFIFDDKKFKKTFKGCRRKLLTTYGCCFKNILTITDSIITGIFSLYHTSVIYKKCLIQN